MNIQAYRVVRKTCKRKCKDNIKAANHSKKYKLIWNSLIHNGQTEGLSTNLD